ncbi:VGLU2-like protein [Mya arenaria]|uniref:VGLU2-like protein n=1 Tax=Mya arenaria TaxID=6604 RepID=A0ABY7E4Z3_MYAAR|nr:VGLU2-like protein [Mya arenaria]
MASERSGGERTEFQTAEEQHELLKHRKYLSIVNCMPKRYVVGIMAFFGFCNIYALRVNLSVAIVAMTENQTKHIGGNKTVIPGGYLATRLGGKYLFGGGVFLTALFTLITPLCARWSGVTYPSIHAIWSKWAPPQEKTKLATLAFSGSYIGTVISLPMSAALAQTSAGWPKSPAKHPTISNAELEYIQGNIGYTDEQVQDVSPPWRSILTSLPVWAIVAAHFAENWGFYTWLTELPTFMNNVLHFNMYQAGFLAALPYLVMAFVVQGSGHLGDFLRGRVQVSTEAVRKIFTCGAFAFQVVFMIAAGYSTSRTSCMVCLTIAVGIGGFAWGGFSVNHLDIAPQFASILMGLSNTFATLPGIISPYLTGVIVTTKIVFYLAAIIYIFGAIVYGLLASGVRQKWAEVMTGYLPHHEVIITTMPETHQE